MKGEVEIVRNFLTLTLALRVGRANGCFMPGQGLMPTSFKVSKVEEAIVADFGNERIARVARLILASGGFSSYGLT